MPRKVQSSSDDATESRDVRKRVVKACQRCRLKKCKCDGATPCTRCKNDDTICTYGKHKKSDKIIFRKGYVQMLERQQAQLIAGVQELYRRIQNGQGWPSAPLELVNHGQPLTHKILEGLGVLRVDEWDDGETQNGMPLWSSFEQQAQETKGMMNDDASTTTSPTMSTRLSPVSTTQATFPYSTIMARRLSKIYPDTTTISQPVGVPSTVAREPYEIFSYNPEVTFPKPSCYHHNLPLQLPASLSMFSGSDNVGYSEDGNPPYANLEWMSMTDETSNHESYQCLPLRVQI